MKPGEMKKAYDPKDFEDRLYQFWQEEGVFAPIEDDSKGNYVIVIPPPNVTGVLHMGHGLNNSLQDILARYHRMLGKSTLWVPGTDHAGIATQNVVERRLRAEGVDRETLGREKFVEETWKVKDEHHAIITRQLKKIGASVDWSRERFTLDEGLSEAVKEVFVSLYEKGLIYKGNYLINWCGSCGTALSDDEVEHEELQGKMYHYNYPLADGSGMIEIATTRPETMLGDTAVAVNPEDERYRHLVGKMVSLPLTGREIPIIADSYVSMEFGTGAVKITPAHDPNDYEIGIRHNLPKINILNPDCTLNNNVPEKYRGLEGQVARKQVVEDLKELGLYIKDEEHIHQVGHCYRCHKVIEPYLSAQWFVKMKPLADKAMAAWKKDEIRFYPKKWENTYAHWMNNIRDWCISRQLWWGHRIPVWYCGDCGEMMVLRQAPEKCAKCGSSSLTRDNDVLDTWFSSWLWPFSTLGWPARTEDLKKFYPTSTLVTAYDIIFFWVSRMVMAGLEFTGEVPFRDIYIHGLVRDKQGRKMSKSLGNGIDPLEIVDEYGADALKFTLAFLAAQGQDIPVDKDTFKIGSKFANKIWNASRYIFMNVDGRNLKKLEEIELREVDLWIFQCLDEASGAVQEALEKYKFNDAAQAVYEFIWNDFCDWYIEASKLSLYSQDEGEKDRGASLLVILLEEALKLAHPFLSFITEEIYQYLPVKETKSIVRSSYPSPESGRGSVEARERFAFVQELVRGVRTLRSEFNITLDKKIRVSVKTESSFSTEEIFTTNREIIINLIGASVLDISSATPDATGAIPVVGRGFEVFVYVKDLVDVPKELARLKKEKEKNDKEIRKSEAKLSNATFLSKAPEDVVEKVKEKTIELKRRVEKIEKYAKLLEG